MKNITDLKLEIGSLENMADRNGLTVKGLGELHQKRLELKDLMDIHWMEKMNKELHIKRHQELHKTFDELCADFIKHTNKLLSKTTVMELMKWSFEQTKNPVGE